uniref:Adenosine deaminase-like protein n=1 Tax=Rhizophora mucronata TaxID=61149 RepID=A0A2P2MJZ3_RHIMU
MTIWSYMEAVMKGLWAVGSVDVYFASYNLDARTSANSTSNIWHGTTGKKYLRLPLSIDHREKTEAAMETVKLALEMRDSEAVGISTFLGILLWGTGTFLTAA